MLAIISLYTKVALGNTIEICDGINAVSFSAYSNLWSKDNINMVQTWQRLNNTATMTNQQTFCRLANMDEYTTYIIISSLILMLFHVRVTFYFTLLFWPIC